jgi:hypothetical protein
MATVRNPRGVTNRRFPMLVVGATVPMGVAWFGGVVAASGGQTPTWAVPAAGVSVVASAGFAWVLAKVNHGGDEGPRRRREVPTRHERGDGEYPGLIEDGAPLADRLEAAPAWR